MTEWRLAGSLIQLRSQFDAAWPNRSRASDGTIGNLAHQLRQSDHNPDEFGVVRAIDLTEDLTVGLSMNDVTERVRLAQDPRLKYCIHEGRMFSSYPTSSYPAWTWRPYSGLNDHAKHGHFSVVDGPLADDLSLWHIGVATLDGMSARQWNRDTIAELVAAGIIEPNTSATVDYWSSPARTDAEMVHLENVVIRGLTRRAVAPAPIVLPKHDHDLPGRTGMTP